MEMTGVFWGAFDPATKAHLKIITTCLEKLHLDRLIVVVNNHSYKKYKFPLKERMEKILQKTTPEEQKKILLISQEDSKKMDYPALAQITNKPLCAIAGYDAYRLWNNFSNVQERALYHKIIVIPRGDETPHLFDAHAELLWIDPLYKHISSASCKL